MVTKYESEKKVRVEQRIRLGTGVLIAVVPGLSAQGFELRNVDRLHIGKNAGLLSI